MKRLLYIALIAIFAVTAASCDREELYSPIEFGVELAPSNTFRVGEEVKFNISGNANFITFWSGEGQHEYKYRARKSVAIEDIETCQLEISVAWQYGKQGILRFFVSNTAQGLKGKGNRDADLTYVRSLETSDFEGWTEVEYTLPTTSGTALSLVATKDIKEFADNFAMMIWCKPTLMESQAQSDFRVNAFVKLKIKGLPEQIINVSTQLGMVAFSPTEERKETAYDIATTNNATTKGYVQYQSDPQILFIGQVSAVQVQNENFVCTTPQPLNIVAPDKGVNIKGYADLLTSYPCRYNTPGTYTATFVAGAGNYVGQSSDVKEFTFTIIEPVE